MFRPRTSLSFVLVTLLAAGCAGGPQPSDAPARVDALATAVERFHAEAGRSRQAIADSFEQLHVLGSGEFAKDNALAAYTRFVQSIDATEQQARQFDATLEAMQNTAAPVFEQWQADLERILNERVHERSAARLAATKDRFQAILTAAAAARGQLGVHIQALRDYATFLAHDFNASSLADLREVYATVTADVQQLDTRFDVCQGAARVYVENSALPTAAAPGR